jgi:hypothetical protein
MLLNLHRFGTFHFLTMFCIILLYFAKVAHFWITYIIRHIFLTNWTDCLILRSFFNKLHYFLLICTICNILHHFESFASFCIILHHFASSFTSHLYRRPQIQLLCVGAQDQPGRVHANKVELILGTDQDFLKEKRIQINGGKMRFNHVAWA